MSDQCREFDEWLASLQRDSSAAISPHGLARMAWNAAIEAAAAKVCEAQRYRLVLTDDAILALRSER